MKLYDRLMSESRLIAGGNTTPETDASMRALLRQATRYKVDSIAEHFWLHPDTDAWSLHDLAYFPSLKPPGKIAWMEYTMPKRVMLGGHAKPRYNPMQGRVVGGLLSALSRDDHPDHFDDLPESAYWIIQLFLYHLNRGKGAEIVQGDYNITAVTGDGTVAIASDGTPHTYVHIIKRPGLDAAVMSDAVSQWIKPFFLTCSFLAADNVEVVERKPKQRGHRKPRPFTPYNEIAVYPAKRRYSGGGRSESSGRDKSKRKPFIGHFRRYGYGGRGLLFGKWKKIVYVEGKPDDIDRDVRRLKD